MQPDDDQIIISRKVLKNALLEMEKQEVRVSWLFTHYFEHLQRLAESIEMILCDYKHQAAQRALIEALMPSGDWALVMTEEQIAAWEAEFEVRYTPTQSNL